MRKVILMMLLAVMSSSAAAEWVAVDRSESITTYIDSATIRKNGNMAKMWSLLDINGVSEIGGKQIRSTIFQTQYDCEEEQSRTLYFSLHSENMGGGGLIHSDSDPHKWIPVKPNGIDRILWKVACGKLKLP